jgi:hypothetical protein
MLQSDLALELTGWSNMNRQIKNGAINRGEQEAFLRTGVGLKRTIVDGKAIWIKDPTVKELKLQYGASMTTR